MPRLLFKLSAEQIRMYQGVGELMRGYIQQQRSLARPNVYA